jgi:hypothetical protein
MRFRLKPIHLHLLKHMRVRWTNEEYGAPCFDAKRPFGNSDVESDMHELAPYMETEDIIAAYHELSTALEIILSLQTFEVGDYQNVKGSWVRI